ncbi:MAG: hypothetical protein ACP6IS_03480 [Candidatus Asgardarchaeia archaeon]
MGLLKGLFGGLFQESRIKVKMNLTPEEMELRKSALIEYIRINKATERLRCMANDCTMLYKQGFIEHEFFNSVMIETMKKAQQLIPKSGTLKAKLVQLGVPVELLELINKGLYSNAAKHLTKLGISPNILNAL